MSYPLRLTAPHTCSLKNELFCPWSWSREYRLGVKNTKISLGAQRKKTVELATVCTLLNLKLPHLCHEHPIQTTNLSPPERGEQTAVRPINRWPAGRGLPRSRRRRRRDPGRSSREAALTSPGLATSGRPRRGHALTPLRPGSRAPVACGAPAPSGAWFPPSATGPRHRRGGPGRSTCFFSKPRFPGAGTPAGSPRARPPGPVRPSTQAPNLLDAAEWPGHGDASDVPSGNLGPSVKFWSAPGQAGTTNKCDETEAGGFEYLAPEATQLRRRKAGSPGLIPPNTQEDRSASPEPASELRVGAA